MMSASQSAEGVVFVVHRDTLRCARRDGMNKVAQQCRAVMQPVQGIRAVGVRIEIAAEAFRAQRAFASSCGSR